MQRPNILVLYTDQQRWDALGAAGNPDVLTPNLDRLASVSANFTHHFVQAPVCMPSRASFLSGQYPANLGITHMGVPLPESIPLVSHYLKPYGYRTANIGKLHALPHANRDHRVPHPSYGFDNLEISDEPGPYEDAYRAWVRSRSPESLGSISVGLPPTAVTWQQTMNLPDSIRHPEDRLPLRAVPFPADAGLTHTAFVGEQTSSFIEQQGANPWFCIAGFYSPHSPWVVPQKYLDLYDPAELTLPDFDVIDATDPRGRHGTPPDESALRSITHGYYAMISEVDDHVGQILDTLDRTGAANSTMIVFTSDHGEWLGRYGRFGKGYPADDAVSRVPLLIKLPGRSIGSKVDHIVEAIDVLPTMLETASIQVPPNLQGTSLLPMMIGDSRAAAVEVEIGVRPWEDVDPPRRQFDHPGVAITEQNGWKSLRTKRFRYLVEADGGEHLFDLDRDNRGLLDVVTDSTYQSDLAECRATLVGRLIARERPLPRTWTY